MATGQLRMLFFAANQTHQRDKRAALISHKYGIMAVKFRLKLSINGGETNKVIAKIGVSIERPLLANDSSLNLFLIL